MGDVALSGGIPRNTDLSYYLETFCDNVGRCTRGTGSRQHV